MTIKNKVAVLTAVLLCLNIAVVLGAEVSEKTRYPNYSGVYLGEDKFENFNRKMFSFNTGLNKYIVRPVNVVWASVVPKYGIERIQGAYTNIEYPKRLVSTIVQRDFKAAGKETARFLTNSTIGLGGLYDPAKKYLKIDHKQEDMDQALGKYKIKQGRYIVLPILSSTTTRGIFGKILDAALEPSYYFGTPIVAIVKAGLFVNKTTYAQPLAKMVESTFADPYDIAKKLFGLENYIKAENFDRKDVLTLVEQEDEGKFVQNEGTEIISAAAPVEQYTSLEEDELLTINDQGAFLERLTPSEDPLRVDIHLKDYKAQNPVTDSMRTALFEIPGVSDSKWSEISVWNKCFEKQIKTANVSVTPERSDYKYRYILQKDKNSPLAIIYPSIGEGVTSHHSAVLGKILFDEGYSVVIQGSHFHWEFAKSMPKGYAPGLPTQDTVNLRNVTQKIVAALEQKYDCKFSDKIVLGTSFGAFETLFLANSEEEENTLNISKYIAISPPIELMYSLKELDKNNDEWDKSPLDIKHATAVTAAKVIRTTQEVKEGKEKIETLPFSEREAKLITGFIMRQKLSDLVFALEDIPKNRKSGFYEDFANMSYEDYVQKYIIKDNRELAQNVQYITSLHSIAPFLKNSDKYKIYHTKDDYFINQTQLKELKKYTQDKTVILSDGAHLGFLYRKEFQDDLRKSVAKKGEAVILSSSR